MRNQRPNRPGELLLKVVHIRGGWEKNMFTAAFTILHLIKIEDLQGCRHANLHDEEGFVIDDSELSQLLGYFLKLSYLIRKNTGKCHGQLGSNDDNVIAADDKSY